MRAAQPTRLIRVIVADNSAIHSELLSEALGRDRRFTVVGSATSSPEVRRLVGQSMPDVLLISSSLDDKPVGGLDTLAEFRDAHPRLKTVVLLDSPKRDIIVEAFRLGARGVFSRNSPVKVLGKCISCVQGGQIWASSQELGFLLEALATFERIKKFQKAWHPYTQNTRRCQTHRFPYGVIYQILESEILVVAVANLHRRPGYWSDRIRENK